MTRLRRIAAHLDRHPELAALLTWVIAVFAMTPMLAVIAILRRGGSPLEYDTVYASYGDALLGWSVGILPYALFFGTIPAAICLGLSRLVRLSAILAVALSAVVAFGLFLFLAALV
jgi:hypothetical protein